jgi:hypothetical protein
LDIYKRVAVFIIVGLFREVGIVIYIVTIFKAVLLSRYKVYASCGTADLRTNIEMFMIILPIEIRDEITAIARKKLYSALPVPQAKALGYFIIEVDAALFKFKKD